MPRVPVYEAPKVAARAATPNYRRGNYDSGMGELSRGVADLGQGLQQVGADQEAIRQKAQHQARQIQVTDAVTRAQKRVDARFYGDVEGQGLDPSAPSVLTGKVKGPTGYTNLRGLDAANSAPDYLNAIRSDLKEIEETIPDPIAREVYKAKVSALDVDANRRVQQHAAKERDEAEVATLKAGVESALGAIAAHPEDGEGERLKLGLLEDAIRARARSPEEGQALVDDTWRASTTSRLDALLAAKDWRTAKALLGERKELLGPKAKAFTEAVAKVELDVESEVVARKIIDLARKETSEVDPRQALEAITAIPEGPQRENVQKRVEHQVAVEGKKWDSLVDERFSRALSTYVKAKTLSAIPTGERTWLEDNAPKKWRELQQMEKADRPRGSGAGGRKGPTPQNRAMTRFLADIAANPSKYAEGDYGPDQFDSEWAGQLDRSDYDEAAKKFAATKKENQVQLGEFSRFLGERVNSNATLRADRQSADEFRAYMGERRRQFIEEKKRPPNFGEMNDMEAEAWKVAVIKRYRLGQDYLARDDKKPMFRVTVPPGDRSAIEDAIRRSGKSVSEDVVRRIYIKKLERAERGE
jgi:hypothetical protein